MKQSTKNQKETKKNAVQTLPRLFKGMFHTMIVVCVAMMSTCLASCQKDDCGYYETEKALFGQWETDEIATAENNGITKYKLEIAASDKHSVSPFRMTVLRKDGKWHLYKRGTMGHLNSDPDDVIQFVDNLDAYGTWRLQIVWLNDERTKAVLYHDRNYNDVVFYKTANTTEYDKTWLKDVKF